MYAIQYFNTPLLDFTYKNVCLWHSVIYPTCTGDICVSLFLPIQLSDNIDIEGRFAVWHISYMYQRKIKEKM